MGVWLAALSATGSAADSHNLCNSVPLHQGLSGRSGSAGVLGEMLGLPHRGDRGTTLPLHPTRAVTTHTGHKDAHADACTHTLASADIHTSTHV